MGQDGFKDFIRTSGIVHKKPVSAKLIVNSEGMVAIRKVDPGFRHVVGYKSSDHRAI